MLPRRRRVPRDSPSPATARWRCVNAPQHDVGVEVEQSVIGALLIDGKALSRIAWLRPSDFGGLRHRRIFQAVLDCGEDDGVIDLVTVSDRLRNGGADDNELFAYLGALAQNTPSAANIHRYAELVRKRAVERSMLGAVEEAAELLRNPAMPVAQKLELARAKLKTLTETREPIKPAPLDWRALSTREPSPRRWAVAGWLGYGHVSLMVGAGGIGKSLLGQQLGSCLALGRAFIDEVPAAARTLYWACEDDSDELHRRQAAIARWLEVGLEAFAENLIVRPRHGMENALVVAEFGRVTFTPLIDELREQAGDVGAEVVVLDNAAQLFGASENDRHAVTVFLNALVGALPGRAILLLAHPARAVGSEFSGSSAWENVARTRLYLGSKLPDQKLEPDEQPAEAVRYLARRKANYSSKDWRRFTFRDGVLVPDAVEAQGGIVEHLRDQAAERAVLAGLKRLAELGVTATDGTTSPRFLPRVMTDYKLSDGQSRAELAAAMRRLMLDGRLRRAEVGKTGSRHPVFGLEAALDGLR
jgi:hypothetical protein